MIKSVRKLMALGASFVVAALAFAQTGNYSQSLRTAKSYESQGKLIHAMGSYYDAMAANPSASAEEAYNAFTLLSDKISSGYFLDESLDEFDIYDKWLMLMADYETYWSECVPYDISISELKKDSLNYKTRTANYSAKLSYKKSAKFSAIYAAVNKGFSVAYRSDWDDVSSEWLSGSVSIYNSVADSNLYNGIPMFNMNGKKRVASLWTSNGMILYDIKFNITKDDGTVILSGPRKLVGSSGDIVFENVSQENMRIIDAGDINIVVDGLYLEYGTAVSSVSASNRNWVRNLSEIEIPVASVVIDSVYNSGSQPFNALKLVKAALRGLNGYGNLEESIDGYDFNMVEVEGGDFMMGSTSGDSDETPVHRVVLSDFVMSETEVTQGVYKAVMGTNPSNNSRSERNPVEEVSWYDAIVFCNKLSIELGYTPCYTVNGSVDPSSWNYTPHQGNSIYGELVCDWDADGFRLPTEAEWEYAARGGVNKENYTYSGSNDMNEVGWNEYNSETDYAYECTHEVATLMPNSLGLYDMTGNVREWVWDWYSSSYYGQSPEENPTGPLTGSDRVRRGGDYDGGSSSLRVCYRVYNDPYYNSSYVGFRIVRSNR